MLFDAHHSGTAKPIDRDVPADCEASVEAARMKLMFARAERIGRMGSWEWRSGERRLRWSDGLFRLLGFEPGDVVATPALLLRHTHEADRERVSRALARLQHEGQLPPLEFRVCRRDGAVRHVVATLAMAEGIPGDGLMMTGFVQDVTERRELEEQLVRQAFHDALTDLPNRRLFLDRLDHAVERSRRAGDRVAILLVDIDDFKDVNDGLGHEAGDHLLVALASRLRIAMRDSDTVARLGGDEFVVLCEALRTEHDALRLADRLAGAWAAPFELAGRAVSVTASIGVALSSDREEDAATLLREADAAMYRGKEDGGGRRELFDDAMRVRARTRLRAERDLRTALEREAFRLHYQPVVSLVDGRAVGVEALVRLHHPERGLVAAAEFVPLCEELGLMEPLGRWVLRTGCRDLAAWDRARPGGRPLRLFLNVSARQLARSELPQEIEAAASAGALAPERLSVEITEAAVLEDVGAAAERLGALRALGVQTLLDDFGTGQSSLGHLLRLPLDGLKIDRACVHALGSGDRQAAVVAAVAKLAGELGLFVVAEGVEDGDQLRHVSRLGCHLAQGHHVARPLPPAEAARRMTV